METVEDWEDDWDEGKGCDEDAVAKEGAVWLSCCCIAACCALFLLSLSSLDHISWQSCQSGSLFSRDSLVNLRKQTFKQFWYLLRRNCFGIFKPIWLQCFFSCNSFGRVQCQHFVQKIKSSVSDSSVREKKTITILLRLNKEYSHKIFSQRSFVHFSGLKSIPLRKFNDVRPVPDSRSTTDFGDDFQLHLFCISFKDGSSFE